MASREPIVIWELWAGRGDCGTMLCPQGSMCGNGKTPQPVLLGVGARLLHTFTARGLEQAKRIAERLERKESKT